MTIPYLRRALAAGPVVGTFVKWPRPEVVHVLAGWGVDFVVCDHEHAQISEREAREVIRAVPRSGCRWPSASPISTAA